VETLAKACEALTGVVYSHDLVAPHLLTRVNSRFAERKSPAQLFEAFDPFEQEVYERVVAASAEHAGYRL
jgi:hypothetical protein